MEIFPAFFVFERVIAREILFEYPLVDHHSTDQGFRNRDKMTILMLFAVHETQAKTLIHHGLDLQYRFHPAIADGKTF
jgi:hypothetical protein